MKLISSSKNPEIKQLRLLYDKSRERKKQGLFVIEGERELQKAHLANYHIDKIFLEEGSQSEHQEIKQLIDEKPCLKLEKSIFQQISRRSGAEKIIAIAKSKKHQLETLKLPENALVLVIEAPEKPGNIGALYRTAKAANLDAVIIANPKTDFYNPNSIRSSLGGLFLIPTAIATSNEVVDFLNQKDFAIATTTLATNAVSYNQYDYKTPCALVMGTESTGLENSWSKASHHNLIIPMHSSIDSLNLSVSAGILMYEAARKNKRLE